MALLKVILSVQIKLTAQEEVALELRASQVGDPDIGTCLPCEFMCTAFNVQMQPSNSACVVFV